ncbi:TRAP transporter small permease [Sphaerotilaceae bacterium SBD11-9]
MNQPLEQGRAERRAAPSRPDVPSGDRPAYSPAEGPSDGHILNEKGEFEIHDEAIDLCGHGIEDWLAVGLFWMLGLIVFYQFFTRYMLNDSAAWTEEIARYFLIATVFIGAAVGVRKNNHIQVDYFYRVLPRRLMRVMSTLVDAVRIAFLAACIVMTWQLIGKIGGSPMAVVDLPMGLVYGAVMLGFAFMTWRAVQVAIGNWQRGASVLEKPELADGPEMDRAAAPGRPPAQGRSPSSASGESS